MKPLESLAQRIRELANEIDGLDAQVSLPAQACTLQEAANKLWLALGVTVGITPPTVWRTVDGIDLGDGWIVWDGKKNYHSHSLEAAVEACIADHKPKPTMTLAAVQSVLDQATIPF
jgi:hypothetical protein